MRVLLTGSSGQVGGYLRPRLIAEGFDLLALGGPTGSVEPRVDLADPGAFRLLDDFDPDAILHAAAIASADRALKEPDLTRRVNVEATRNLADWCRDRARRLIFTSTDLVFEGNRPWSREDDPARPVLAYGRSKLDAEAAVLAIPGGLVARLSLLFGPSRSGRESFFDRTLASLRRGEPQTAFQDEFRTPLDLGTAAEILTRLVRLPNPGIVHVGGADRLSRFDLLRRVSAAIGLDPGLIRSNRRSDAAFPEPRPADVSLDTTRLGAWLPELRRPSIEEAARSWGL